GGFAYVFTSGAIRKVNLSTAQVTTLAGSATQTGCVQSNDPTAVRFSNTPGAIDSDGTTIFVDDEGCNQTRRVTIATGATSLLASQKGPLTFASDGCLYQS